MQTLHQRGMMQHEDIHFGIQSNLDISTQGLILKKVHANRLVTFYIFDTIMKILNMQFSRDDIFTNILMNVIASTCMCEKI